MGRVWSYLERLDMMRETIITTYPLLPAHAQSTQRDRLSGAIAAER